MGTQANFRRDELLEILWHLDEHHSLTLSALREHDPDGDHEEALNEFSNDGSVVQNGEEIILTEKGRSAARGIIRRHRLAERLLTDVLGKKVDETETAACEFEHLLAPEIVDSICTLLGHPHQCPHGSPIPEGACCAEARQSVASAVVPLTELKAGEHAKVAFLNMDDELRVNKITSAGITPGTEVAVQQTSPTMVLEIGQNLIALDGDLAKEIKVWKPE